jgi:hypothetical protein
MMKMSEKLSSTVKTALESASMDYNSMSRSQRFTIYSVRLDGGVPLDLTLDNQTGRKRTEKQAAKDWEQSKAELYSKRLAEFESGKLAYELNESFAKEGYRSRYQPGEIQCHAVDNYGFIIAMMSFGIAEQWFANCEDYTKKVGESA